MEYTYLANSDLKVSKLCLGCMGFGEPTAERYWLKDYESTKEIIKRALELGINFFDTSMAYNLGTSEEYLGRCVKELGEREDFVIATKFLPMPDELFKVGKSTQEYIEECLDGSLSRLGLDYVDLYIYHIWDFKLKIEDVMEGLNNLVKKGKVKYIGISNCYAYQLAMCNDVAEKNGWAKFISIQGHYNLIFREEEREMARYCKEANVAMTPYSSLASGRLAKKPGETSKRLEGDAFAKSKYDGTKETDELIINRVIELADKYGVSMSEVSLAWLMKRTASPLIGASSVAQIEQLAKAADLKLTEEDEKYLEELYVPHKIVGVMAAYK